MASVLLLPTGASAGGDTLARLWQRVVGVAESLPLATWREGAEWQAAWFRRECAPPSHHRDRADALRAEASERDADPGLAFEGRISQGVSGSQTGERDSFVGFNWRLLGDGYLDNHRWARQLERRASLAQMDARADYRRRNVRCQSERLIERFQKARIRLLQEWSTFLDAVLPAVRRTYLNGRSLFDRLIELEADRRLVRRQLESLPAPVAGTREALPRPFAIDFEALRRAMRNDPLRQRRLSARTAVARNDAALEADERRRLGAFLRYETDEDTFESGGVTAGVRFSMPLFGDQGNAKPARIREVRREARNELDDRLLALRRLEAEFEEQQRRTIRQHYRYLQALERLRRSVAAYRVPEIEAELGTAVTRANTALDAANERLLAMRLLYRKASRVFEAAGLLPRASFLRPVELPVADYRSRTGRRALYVWSTTLQRYSAAALVEFARARGVRQLLVSAGPDAARGADALPAALLRAAKSAGLPVQRLLGANSWALPRNRANALQRLAAMDLPSGGLHLDVEPQTLNEGPGTSAEHLEGYLRLVEGARARLPRGMPLNVSVPATWSIDTYRRVAASANRLYVMAYPSDATQTVIRRVRRVASAVGREAVVIAVRVADFDSASALDQAITRWQAATGIRRFALQDAGALMRLTDGANR